MREGSMANHNFSSPFNGGIPVYQYTNEPQLDDPQSPFPLSRYLYGGAQSFSQGQSGFLQANHTPNGSSQTALDNNALNQNSCTSCGSVPDTNGTVHAHVKNPNHPTFVCSCNQSFTRHSSLKRHIATQAPRRAFRCDYCEERMFTRLDKLLDHCKSFHKFSESVLSLMRSQNSQHRAHAASQNGHDSRSVITTLSLPSYFSSPAVLENSPRLRLPDIQHHGQGSASATSGNAMNNSSALVNEQAPPLDQQFPWEYLDDQFSSVNEQRPTNI